MDWSSLIAKLFGTWFVFCLLGCTPSIDSGDQETIELPPNIVLVITDDQGWGDLKSNGNRWLDTPVLDKLRQDGASFDRFYVSPVCAPTRASLLTGRYYLRTGTTWVTHRKEVMRSEEVTFAEVFKEAGYVTGIFGKWHNGAQYPNDPMGQGFDEFYGFSAGHWNNYFNTDLIHNDTPVNTSGYINDVLTDKAIAFIDENRDRPFLCYVPYNTPHGPFQLPDEYYDKYKAMGLNEKDASVYGMCENLDDNIGLILNRLDSLDLANNTIVVFLTDNGPNGQRYNDGMKGWKGHIDEGGVRVPLFIRWPDKIAPGTTVTPLAAHIDLLPTLAELCQVSLPPDIKMDGRSLVPLLFGEGADWPERNIYTVRSGASIGPVGALRNQQYRMVLDRDGAPQLYDMLDDPGQQHNLSDRLPNLTQKLKDTFMDWFDQVKPVDTSPPPIPVGYPERPITELPAPEALLSGSVSFKGERGWSNDWIINWEQITDTVSWKIDVEEAADFEIQMLYACHQKELGSTIRLSIGNQSLIKEIDVAYNREMLPSPDRVPRGEVYERKWGLLDLGELHLGSGPQTITLSAERIAGVQVAELKSLRLRRLNGNSKNQ